MKSRILANRASVLKETQKEVGTICREKEIKALIAEYGGEFHEKSAMTAKMEMAITLSEMGMTIDKTALAVKMDVDTVAQWIDCGAVAGK